MKTSTKPNYDINVYYKHLIGQGVVGYRNSIIYECEGGIVRFTYIDETGQARIQTKDLASIYIKTVKHGR